MAELSDGQIYRWRWADEAQHQAGLRSWGAYHCRSQIAVVRDGRLFDTYWSDNSDKEIDPKRVELTFFADGSWQKISEWEAVYYATDDIADTRHPNNSRAPIYLRPGAQRDAATILGQIEYREETARSDIKSAEHQLGRMSELRRLLDANRLDEVML